MRLVNRHRSRGLFRKATTSYRLSGDRSPVRANPGIPLVHAERALDPLDGSTGAGFPTFVAGVQHNHEPLGHPDLDDGRHALVGLPKGIDRKGSRRLVAPGFITETALSKSTSYGPSFAIPSAPLGTKHSRPFPVFPWLPEAA